MSQQTKRCLWGMLLSMAVSPAFAVAQSNIDADNKWAWSENCGWTNWQHDAPKPGDGVIVTETFLAGFVWGENIGWINLGDGSPADGIHYANETGDDFGVNMDPDSGDLFGMAWGENVGWINFEGGAMAEPPKRARLEGCQFRGFVWGENIGWINLGGEEHFVQVEGIGCDDGDACTIGDTCLAGSCSGSAVGCSDPGNQCNTASCDPAGADGNCDILTPVKDGTECDDEAACTENDQCTVGICGGTDVDCSDAAEQCNAASCDPDGADGNCDILTPVKDGTACDDEAACTENDQCTGGMCGGTDVDCSDAGDQCNAASCDPNGVDGNCEILAPLPESTGCDDVEVCTSFDGTEGADDACDGNGTCLGTPVDCSDLNDQCNVGVCHPTTGECVTLTNNEDDSCVDGNACTENDTCSAGTCSGVPVECPEGQVCDETGECVCGPCPTDVDGNGETEAFDLANLLGAWGPVTPNSACLDADGNGFIEAFDLAVLLGAWGPCQ